MTSSSCCCRVYGGDPDGQFAVAQVRGQYAREPTKACVHYSNSVSRAREVVNSEDGGNKIGCVCASWTNGQAHDGQCCGQFTAMTGDEEAECVGRKGLCFDSLARIHVTRQCYVPLRHAMWGRELWKALPYAAHCESHFPPSHPATKPAAHWARSLACSMAAPELRVAVPFAYMKTVVPGPPEALSLGSPTTK